MKKSEPAASAAAGAGAGLVSQFHHWELHGPPEARAHSDSHFPEFSMNFLASLPGAGAQLPTGVYYGGIVLEVGP